MTSRKLLSVLVSLLATALAAGCDDPSDAEEPTPSFEGWYQVLNAKKDSAGVAEIQRLAVSFDLGECRATGSWSAETKDSTFAAVFKSLEGCGKTLSEESVWNWSFAGDTLSLSADGKPVWRERVSPIYHADASPIAVRELLLDMQVATTEDLSARPVAMLYVATDEGKLYADAGWKGIGRTGRYRDVVRWFNVGYGRTFSARVVFSENCDVTLFALRLGIEEGSPR